MKTHAKIFSTLSALIFLLSACATPVTVPTSTLRPTGTATSSLTPTTTPTSTPIPPTDTPTPSPTPEPPTAPDNFSAKVTCTKTFNPWNPNDKQHYHVYRQFDLVILFSWEDTSNTESGFEIYKNNELLQTLRVRKKITSLNDDTRVGRWCNSIEDKLDGKRYSRYSSFRQKSVRQSYIFFE